MKTDSQIIDLLGGTSAVAALCQVKDPSVSEWRTKGIPRARRMFLEVVRPDVFEKPEAKQPQSHVPVRAAA